MDSGIRQITHMMEKLVSHLLGDLVSFFNREFWTHGEIDLCMNPVAQPPCPHFSHLMHSLDVIDCVLDLIKHRWLDAVE